MHTTKIMVVEDEGIVAADIQDRLKALGYGIAGVAPSGEEAQRLAGQTKPDLVLMDIMLKGKLDGVAAAEYIRAEYDIPVVFLTAHADETTLQRAKITAPFGYILKPFEERELHTTVEIALYRHLMESRVKKAERWLAAVLTSIGDLLVATDKWGLITFMNPIAVVFTGWSESEALGKPLAEVFRLVDPVTRQPAEGPVSQVIIEEVVVNWRNNLHLIARNGAEIPVDYTAAPIRDDQSNIAGIVWVFRDISQRKRADEERESLIKDLQRALADVKTLSGLLPICAGCKKIRDDRGYWQQVEEYISNRSEARFTHGYCPECIRRLYPEIAQDILRDMSENKPDEPA